MLGNGAAAWCGYTLAPYSPKPQQSVRQCKPFAKHKATVVMNKEWNIELQRNIQINFFSV